MMAMFKIECKKEFQMPLKVQSFQERYQKLLNKNKKKKIVYIKNEFDNSTFRYRCYNFIESLYKNEKYDITYFLCEEIPSILKYLNKMSMIVFQRTSWTNEVENIIYMAKLCNIKLVYDMDDLLYKIDYVPSFINHICRNYSSENISLYLSIASAYELVAKKCDYFITTTPFLQKQLIKDFNKPTYIIPNFLNNEQLEETNFILKKRVYNNSKFIIGYFSGSPSHKADFHIVENDIIKLLEKYPNIYLKIVGFMELEGKLKDYFNKGRVIIKDLVPYQKLQYEIGSVDVNIIPLVQNDFNQGKSELKFFESGILKIPSCISKTNVYEKFVQNGVNGLFCNQGQWFEKLELLYLNPSLRTTIGNNAYETVKNIYLPQEMTKTIENVYNSICTK